MKKLSLQLDELRVESFETSTAERSARGTVHGNLATASCPGYSCAPTCGIPISPDFGREANASYQVCCV
jgi:hypothetical protein